MKLNMKAIAAAAILAASGVSQAQIALQTTPNPDVYFAAFDQGAQVGFVLDTNVGWSSLTGAYSFTYDLDSSAAWNTFKSTAQSNGAATGIQWGVYSAKSGTTVAANSGILVGNNDATTSPAVIIANASGVRTGVTTVGNFANSLAPDSNNGVFVNGPNVAATINDTGTFAGRLSWDSTERYVAGTLSSQNLFKIAIANPQSILLVGTASIDAGNVLSVAAPVPEPGTYALMFAGLLAMGAVVRRRNSR